MNAPDPPHWTLNSCFGVFHTLWVHLGPFCCLTNLISNWSELSCHEVVSEFFTTNAPDPPHCTLNWCFGVFRIICVHSWPFGWLTKLGAKRGDVVLKFGPQSRVGIFRNERIRSTPLHRKLTFWCVSFYMGAFVTVWLPYENRCKTGRTSVKVRATKSRRNFSQRTHPIHPIVP